jgi:hypothetical protein
VVTAGLAEIAAGSIAMGLGGYLAARSDAEHYASREAPRGTRRSSRSLTRSARGGGGVPPLRPQRRADRPILALFREADEAAWVDFMMRFELGLERPEPGRAQHGAR